MLYNWCFLKPIYVLCCFFFFKQKTAYEMRISDWSSDVCSSDLRASAVPPRPASRSGQWAPHPKRYRQNRQLGCHPRAVRNRDGHRAGTAPKACFSPLWILEKPTIFIADCRQSKRTEKQTGRHPLRSEEHTSELQSLMRISYAVFCLKKQK